MINWTVYIENINAKNRIAKHNVFDHGGFFEDCKKNYKKNRNNKDAFLDQLRRNLSYRYRFKSEWEVVVKPKYSQCERNEIKIDVYQQVRMNWERFCEYVWANKEEFKEEKKNIKRKQKSDSHI